MTHVLFYKTIDSTQLEARRYIQGISSKINNEKKPHNKNNNNNESIVFVAKNQTNGIGRQNRGWKNRDSMSLLTTICIKKRTQNQSLNIMPIVAGVCVLRALNIGAKRGISNISLKWPNDLLHNGNKLGGILTESFLDYFIIGIGINLLPHSNISGRVASSLSEAKCLPSYFNISNSLKQNVSEIYDEKNELIYSRDYATDCKTNEIDDECADGSECNNGASRESLIQLAGLLTKEIESEIANIEINGASEVVNEWRKNAWGIGDTVSFHKSSDNIIAGKMINIDEDGGLLIEVENGDIKKFTIGEILL